MTDKTLSMDQARDDFKSGDYESALRAAQGFLLNPDGEQASPVEVWLLLAAVWQAMDLQFESEIAYRQAAKLLPERIDIKMNLAHLLRRNEQRPEAEQVYREIAQRSPNNVPACLALMEFLAECRRFDDAIAEGEAMLAAGIEKPELRQAIGNAHFAAGRFDEALGVYQSALIFTPTHAALLYAAALAAMQTDKTDQAEQFLLRLLNVQPDNLNALLKLADLKKTQGYLDAVVDYASHAIVVAPDVLEPHQRLSDALIDLRRTSAAIGALLETIDAGCAVLTTYVTLAELLLLVGDYHQSQVILEAARTRFPDSLALQGLELRWQRMVCDWEGLADKAESLLAKVLTVDNAHLERVDPRAFVGTTVEPSPAAMLQMVQQFSNRYQKNSDLRVYAKPVVATDGGDLQPPLRVAYLLNASSFARRWEQLLGLVGRHDRVSFQPSVYVLADYDLLIPEVCREAGFVSLAGKTVAQSASLIAVNRIDVLISLMDDIEDVLPILALRPAPIQCAWPGFAATLGGKFVDYILVDSVVFPDSEIPYFSEAPIQLPDTLQYLESQLEPAQIVPIRTVCGLPAHGFVFANFSQPEAIDPDSFSAWMDILRQVPDSVLWLGVSHPMARQNLMAKAAHLGVKPQRIVFADAAPVAEHLARLRHADLYLSPRYDVTCDALAMALWAGVPALACEGSNGMAGRMAQSVLFAADLADCVSPDLQAFSTRAVDLALDPHALHALRVQLADRKSSAHLFDSGRFVAHLERALQAVWVNYLQGNPPYPLRVEPILAEEVRP